MALQFNYFRDEDGEEFITVFVPGSGVDPQTAGATHPNFYDIVDAARNGDPSVVKMFDLAQTVSDVFAPLSERVSVGNGRVYFDNDEVHGSITDHIVRALGEGSEDLFGLVQFMEKVNQNPHPHSREQLYDWITKHHFTIDDEGDLVAYKGVTAQGNDTYTSIHSGSALVNGERKSGQIPQEIGDVVEMPRLAVHHDPAVGCSTGLHVGTWDYASSFGSTVLQIAVNPRDVVSVPTDCNWQKVRVCRYQVVDVLEVPFDTAILHHDTDDSGWDDDVYYCDYCGSDEHYEEDCEIAEEDYAAADDEYENTMLEREAAGDDDDGYCGDPACAWCSPPEDEDNGAQEALAGIDAYLDSLNTVRSANIPTEGQWQVLLNRVASRKQSLVNLAQAQGWKLVNPDEPKVRESWSI